MRPPTPRHGGAHPRASPVAAQVPPVPQAEHFMIHPIVRLEGAVAEEDGLGSVRDGCPHHPQARSLPREPGSGVQHCLTEGLRSGPAPPYAPFRINSVVALRGPD